MKKLVSLLVALVMGIAAFAQVMPSGVDYLSDAADGSITVRSMASGRNRHYAFENAKKLALRTVLFKGVNVPGNASLSKPLILDLNAQDKYEAFFNKFFADGGAWQQYVSMRDKRSGSLVRNASSNELTIQTTVRVLRSELKQYLKDNNIIQ